MVDTVKRLGGYKLANTGDITEYFGSSGGEIEGEAMFRRCSRAKSLRG